MPRSLPVAPKAYNQQAEQDMRRVVEQTFAAAFVRGEDVEIGNNRLILRAPNGSRWVVTVSNSGVLGASAL